MSGGVRGRKFPNQRNFLLLDLYKENPVLDTGFVEAMRLNNNFPTVKLKSRSGNCNKV